LKNGGVVLPSVSTGGEGNDDFLDVTVEVRDMNKANDLAAALRGVEGVQSAYAKPGEELP
jgi:hypothetical protein